MSSKNKIDKPKTEVRDNKNIINKTNDFIEDNKINPDDYCIINGAKIEGNACSTIRNDIRKDV